jgi:iron complex outermembrane recepter protein
MAKLHLVSYLQFVIVSVSELITVATYGQTVTASPSPNNSVPAATQGSEAMQQVIVTAVPPADQIVPTARPISSVFGQDMSVIDIPRSVNVITRAELEDRQIFSVQDLGQFSSGTYTPAEYGLDGIPYIRGIYADILQNGEREIFYRNSVVPSFNQLDSMDIVKGPGSAVYGPSEGGAGGYVNFITKSPEFDGFHETIESTFGALSEGGTSWFHSEWTVDSTGPLIPGTLAYRLSYEGTDGTTYYRNTRDDKEDIYGALTWIPNQAITVQFTGQYYELRANETVGFNHPTQDLIDNQQYVRGTNEGPFTTVTPTGVENIYGFDSLNSPGDSVRGDKLTLQMITTFTINPDLKIVNYQMYEQIHSRQISLWGYDEYVPGVHLYDTRTEVHFDYNFPLLGTNVENHDIFGVAGRFQWGEEFSDYTIQPFAAYDLLSNPDTFNISVPLGSNPNAYGPGGQFGGFAIKGMSSYSAGINGLALSSNGKYYYTSGVVGEYSVYDYGIFYQHQTNWTKWLSSLVGARGDYIDATSQLPTSQLINYAGSNEKSGARVFDTSFFGSLIFKPTTDSSFYLTYDRTMGFQGDANFGGLPTTAGDVDASGHNHSVNSGVLGNKSELYETGYKVSLFRQALFFNIDGFYQTRVESVVSPTGDRAQVQSRGLEVDLDYQPDKHLSITSNFTWLLANYHHFAPYEQTGNYLDDYPTNYIVDGKHGTGVGSPTFTTFPVGNYTLPGTPKVYFNEYAIYKFSNGFGIGIGPQVTGEQKANISGSLKIPAQVTWNAEIFYRQPRWEVQINFFNLTNQANFTVIDPTFTGNDQILEQMPFHVTASVKLKF